MTKAISTLRNSNYGASRQSIMDKYDTNGDGKIDLAELHAFVDDYIINITNNDTLLDRVSNLRRLIGFGTILLLVIALCNLGTAILAANISKDTVIVDGRFVANDGSNAAISTTNAVASITKQFETDGWGRRRNLAVDGAADGTASSPYVCLTQAEIDAISQTSINGSGTSLIIQFDEDDGSTSQTVVAIQGTGHFSPTQVSYPASSVQFNLDTSGLCAGGRRKLSEGDAEQLGLVNTWFMQAKTFTARDCDAERAGITRIAESLQVCVDDGNTLNSCLPDAWEWEERRDRILCPDFPIEEYCDCSTESCTDYRESRCGCESAAFCCEQYPVSDLPEAP